MTFRKQIRTVAGLAAVLTLLGLIALDTIHPEVALSLEDKLLLVSMVSALLGVDLAWNQLPVKLNGGEDD